MHGAFFIRRSGNLNQKAICPFAIDLWLSVRISVRRFLLNQVSFFALWVMRGNEESEHVNCSDPGGVSSESFRTGMIPSRNHDTPIDDVMFPE